MSIRLTAALPVFAVTLFLTLSLVNLAAPRAAGRQQGPESVPGLRYTKKGEIVVPMIFPMMGGCRWSDTYGAPRAGGARKHAGQDLPAPKMRPLLACFDGVWSGSGIRGDNGCYATYYHINNDTPGTDDGQGGAEFAWAPGIQPGTRVRAGQHVAYCGDSGNAENTISHLHFELSVPGKGTINAAASLRAAQVLKKPRYPLPQPELKPGSGELRLDGEVVQVDPGRGVAAIRVAAWASAKGKVTAQTRPLRRWVRLPQETAGETPLRIGDFIAVVGTDPGAGKAIAGSKTVVLRAKPEPRTPPGTIAHSSYPGGGPAPGRASQLEAAYPSRPLLPPPPTPSPILSSLADFEGGDYQGWEIQGNCFGRVPDGARIAGNAVRGWGGNNFLTTAHPLPGSRNPSSGSGSARSAPFVLPEDATEIRFQLAGGNYPERCCVNLLSGSPERGWSMVRTATGEDPLQMKTVTWDVRDLRGQIVRVEIRDSVTSGRNAYLHLDDISLVRQP